MKRWQDWARGLVNGTFVWAASSMGWLPAVHLLLPATEMPARRNLMMAAAHWVWGAMTGIMVDQMEKR